MTEPEIRVLTSYTVNFILSGPGGSLQNAGTMMKAASAIIRAGGAGVFIVVTLLCGSSRILEWGIRNSCSCIAFIAA